MIVNINLKVTPFGQIAFEIGTSSILSKELQPASGREIIQYHEPLITAPQFYEVWYGPNGGYYGVPSSTADIEQPLIQRNLINLAHILPKQSKDVDLHLVETFNEVVHVTVYAHPDPMNPCEQLENPA